MTQKEIKKLSRKQMLEMLAEQTGRTDRLQRENERLKERIADREQNLTQLGELAKTVLSSGGSSTDEAPGMAEERIPESPQSPDPRGDEGAPCGDSTDLDAAVADGEDRAENPEEKTEDKKDAGLASPSTGGIGPGIFIAACGLLIADTAVWVINKIRGRDS